MMSLCVSCGIDLDSPGICTKCKEVFEVTQQDKKLLGSMSLRELLDGTDNVSVGHTCGNVDLEDGLTDVTIYNKAASLTLKHEDFSSLVDIIITMLRKGEIYDR